MKLLCDENVPRSIIHYLSTFKNIQVKSVAGINLKGLSDKEIIERIKVDGSILVTFDKDFSKLSDPNAKIIILGFHRMLPPEIEPYLKVLVESKLLAKRVKGFVIYLDKTTMRFLNQTPAIDKLGA